MGELTFFASCRVVVFLHLGSVKRSCTVQTNIGWNGGSTKTRRITINGNGRNPGQTQHPTLKTKHARLNCGR
jgi:hypothetical protein